MEGKGEEEKQRVRQQCEGVVRGTRATVNTMKGMGTEVHKGDSGNTRSLEECLPKRKMECMKGKQKKQTSEPVKRDGKQAMLCSIGEVNTRLTSRQMRLT